MTADGDRIEIRDMTPSDVPTIVGIAERGAAMTAESSPSDSEEQRSSRVRGLVDDATAVSLVATRDEGVCGYLLATVVSAPPEPAGPSAATGPVAYVTEFTVAAPEEWWTAGAALLGRVQQRLRGKGVDRVLVPVDAPDPAKRALLWRSGLTLEFERYASSLV
ncbi:GNAT family N-acetyltransferase [Halostreptopolyspora alba]|uniref:GNAT family N-acetyltransferase n=1 Tax=Halostreptopolyspora alba TaxID=2487137 RepID=A0A3N0DY67_9ACTN|nr:GNAT family N-acetyltransferase [Nocardiopsaceae bacterium YIM 96095]